MSGFLTVVLVVLSLLSLSTAQLCSSCACTTCNTCNARRSNGACITVTVGDGTNWADQPCVIVNPGVVIFGFTSVSTAGQCLFLEPGSLVIGGINTGAGNDCIVSNGATITGPVTMGTGRDCFTADRTHMGGLDMGSGADVVLMRDVDTDSDGTSVYGDINGSGGNDCISITGTMPGTPSKRSKLEWLNLEDIPQAERPELESEEAYTQYQKDVAEFKRQSPGVFPIDPARSTVGDVNGGAGRDCILILGTDFEILNGNIDDDDISVRNSAFTRVVGGPGADIIDVNCYLAPTNAGASVTGSNGDDLIRAGDSKARTPARIAGGIGTDTCCTDLATVLTAGSCELFGCADFTPTTQPPVVPTAAPTTTAPTTPPPPTTSAPTTAAPTPDPTVPTAAPTPETPTTQAPTGPPTSPPPVPPLPTQDQMIITEILPTPNVDQSGTDTGGEYFEMLNLGNPIDVTGCILSDGSGSSSTVPFTMNVVPNGGRFIAARNMASTTFGAMPPPVLFQFTGFTLSGSGDTVTLTCSGIRVASFTYPSSLSARGRAAQLQPAIEGAASVGNVAAARDTMNWCIAADNGMFGITSGTPTMPNVCP